MLLANSARRIALADCNNFYVSCERAFRPDWERLPVGVLSNNDGCIVARSNELKAAGIPMGAPYFKHKKQLQDMSAVIVSSNYALYGDMSARVMATLSQFTPNIEVYSIDEAWLDLDNISAENVEAYTKEIAKITKQNTGIPVSIGIGPTKVLAKVANNLCKKLKIPGNVLDLSTLECLDTVLKTVKVEDVWGIGRKLAKKLVQEGIYTALDLKNADDKVMRQKHSILMQRLILELRGISCLTFENTKPKQSITASRSFSKRVTTKEELLQALCSHVSRAAVKLRKQQSASKTIYVFARTSKHVERSSYFMRTALLPLHIPTSDTREMIKAVMLSINSLFKEGVPYAKCGVILMDLCSNQRIQSDLFGQADDKKSKNLMVALDGINATFGKRTLFFAGEGVSQSWDMRQDLTTPCYTTRWSDIPIVT